MDATEKSRVLADHLANVLPLARAGGEDAFVHIPVERRRSALWLGTHDADVAAAMEVEVGHLLSAHPDVNSLIAPGKSHDGREELAERLRSVLASDDAEHSRDMLWELLVGNDVVDSAAPLVPRSTRFRRVRRALSDGWLARKTAVVWMNVLIAIPMAVVYLTEQSQVAPGVDDRSAVALKIFAIWGLSFLPGWLYVRFLGQRAGALWNEYVQHLHRLGWDRPEFLPRPPESSEFFAEWLGAKGYLHSEQTNLYRLKFNAYYGRSVSAGNAYRTNFSVTAETMFPVFLTTLILSTGFTAVFWDTRFADDPSSVWDVVKFAFLGSYVFIAQSLIRRFFQSDLRPSAYATSILRIVIVLITVIALHQILRPVDQRNVEAVVAFVVGIFPIIAFQALYRTAAGALRTAVPQLTPDYPLSQLDGLNIWYETRLVEEGIEDMENLATANMVDVMLHTRVPVGRLVDWIDQAHLYLHLDRIERGGSERRKARRGAGSDWPLAQPGKEPLHDAVGTTPAEGGNSQRLAELAHSVGEQLEGALPVRVYGSVGPGYRAGTRTRVALRQLGIRNATDLLKAFPPDQIDPLVDTPSVHGQFKQLEASGVDPDQIRILVRVLDEDTGLAPIWNWQTRGSLARYDVRRPRSQMGGGEAFPRQRETSR